MAHTGRGNAEDLVGDRIRVAVRVFVAMSRPICEDIVVAATGLELHPNQAHVRNRIRAIAKGVMRHWQGEGE